jgi:hypothetical protein
MVKKFGSVMKIFTAWTFAGLFLFSATASAQSADTNNIYSAARLLQFADHLYEHHYYREAAMEYERLWLQNTQLEVAQRMMLRSWRAGADYETGLRKGLMLRDTLKVLAPSVLKEFVALSAWSAHYFPGLDAIFWIGMGTPADSLTELVNLNLVRRDFKYSDSLIRYGRTKLQLDLSSQVGMLQKGYDLRYKKPWLAAGLSTVVPGAGKFYTGEWKDGAFSFLSIAVLAIQSYAGFRKDGIKSPLGIIAGGIAIGFYGANIYGSAKSAVKFNKRTNSNYTDEARNLFYPAP